MKQAVVSAVIPVFNGESFIEQAIRSVLQQTYPAIECIVVDDGSTDHTPQAVATFGDLVRYIRKPNAGVSSARNVGAASATGSFIAFLDADDLWLPRKLEIQMEAFSSNPELGLVYSGLHVVDESLNFRGLMPPPSGEVALRNTLLIEGPVASVAQTGVVRKEVFESLGGFDERLSTSADCDFVCRLALEYPVHAIDQPLVLYRCHPGQMHHDPSRTERDVELVFEKFFNGRLPPDLTRKKRRAYANLYVSLAGTFLIKGDRQNFTRYALRALLMRPDRVADAVRRLSAPGTGLRRAP